MRCPIRIFRCGSVRAQYYQRRWQIGFGGQEPNVEGQLPEAIEAYEQTQLPVGAEIGESAALPG